MSGEALLGRRPAIFKDLLHVQSNSGLTATATVKDYLTVHPDEVCHERMLRIIGQRYASFAASCATQAAKRKRGNK